VWTAPWLPHEVCRSSGRNSVIYGDSGAAEGKNYRRTIKEAR
jgi:hypothetical protein